MILKGILKTDMLFYVTVIIPTNSTFYAFVIVKIEEYFIVP